MSDTDFPVHDFLGEEDEEDEEEDEKPPVPRDQNTAQIAASGGPGRVRPHRK